MKASGGPKVAIVAGFTTDHLVQVGRPAHYFEPGGPGYYAALGAKTVAGTDITVFTPQRPSARHAERLAECGIAVVVTHSAGRDPQDPAELWILDSASGRCIANADRSGAGHDFDALAALAEHTDVLPVGQWPVDTSAVLVSSPPAHWAPGRPTLPQHVVVDPDQRALATHGWPEIERIATYATLLRPSRVQLNQLGTAPETVAIEICHRTGCPVIASLDTHGLIVATPAGVARVPAATVTVIDTTGAGDALSGAIVAALAHGADVHASAEAGVRAAAAAVSDWGGRGLLAAIAGRVPPTL